MDVNNNLCTSGLSEPPSYSAVTRNQITLSNPPRYHELVIVNQSSLSNTDGVIVNQPSSSNTETQPATNLFYSCCGAFGKNLADIKSYKESPHSCHPLWCTATMLPATCNGISNSCERAGEEEEEIWDPCFCGCAPCCLILCGVTTVSCDLMLLPFTLAFKGYEAIKDTCCAKDDGQAR